VFIDISIQEGKQKVKKNKKYKKDACPYIFGQYCILKVK